MKKTIALLTALMLVLLAGCSATPAALKNPLETAAPTAEPTPEPTPEPVHSIPMSGMLTDMLSREQRDFVESLKKDPPVMAVLKLGDKPAAVVLDIDDVRDLCTELSELELDSKTDLTGDADNSVSLIKEDGECCTLSFSGENLAVDGAYYVAQDSDRFWYLVNAAVKDSETAAADNKALLGTEDFYKATYANEDDRRLMRIVSQPAVPGGAVENGQTVSVTLGVTNTAEHLLMSAKLIARFVDAEGRVLASVPVDLDFNETPVYIYETRDYELSQTIYNVGGIDPSTAVGAMIEIVSVNAPNEAGH